MYNPYANLKSKLPRLPKRIVADVPRWKELLEKMLQNSGDLATNILVSSPISNVKKFKTFPVTWFWQSIFLPRSRWKEFKNYF